MDVMDETLESQFISKSMGYLRAAQIIITSEKGGNREVFRTPILHLIAHGLELLFKHVVLKAGKSEDELRDKYGHNLRCLWDDGCLDDLRYEAYKQAEVAWMNAKNSEKYGEIFEEFSNDILDQRIYCLSRLHTSESNFALRYAVELGQEGPIPMLLTDTFLPVANEFLRRRSRGD